VEAVAIPLYGPVLTALIAATLKSYMVSSINPPTMQCDVLSETGMGGVGIHGLDGLVPKGRYCTIYDVI
jgi:hypothetical protein